MNITIGTDELTLTKDDGSTISLNGDTVISVAAQHFPVYTAPTSYSQYQTDVPQVWNPTLGTFTNQVWTYTDQWIIRLKLNDLRYEDIILGSTGGDASGWANSSSGANTGVTAIKAIFS